MAVVVGVDGAGRTHRLRALAPPDAVWVTPDRPGVPPSAAAVVVDDPHRLEEPTLRALSDVARRGVPVLLGRRPTIDRAALAELDELAARDGVVQLGPLDAAAVAALTGRTDLHAPSAGWPAVAALLAADGLLPRVQRRLATVSPGVAEVARTVALGLDLADDVLAGATGQPPDTLADALRTLRDLGFLQAGAERLVPAVAVALLDDLAPAERRRVHARVAAALAASGADPVAAATQLRAARIRTGADVFRAAGDRLRFTDPAAAIGWYADAVDAGAEPALVAAGRSEAAALVGLPVDAGPTDEPAAAHRLALVAGAVATHDGRPARAAEVLAAAAPPGPLLAVPALVALGRAAAARELLAGAPSYTESVNKGPLLLLAEAVLAAGGEPAVALPLLIEAAEAAERIPPAVVLPDTPHALGCGRRGDRRRRRHRRASAGSRTRARHRWAGRCSAAPAAAGLGAAAHRPLRHRGRGAAPAGHRPAGPGGAAGRGAACRAGAPVG